MAKIYYADDFQPDFGIPWRAVLTRAQVEGWDAERLAKYIELRKRVEADAIKNPVGQGWSLPSWDLVQKNWKKYNIHVLLGGNQCLRGDSMIYDPVLGVSRRIDSIKGPHHVWAWDGQKTVIAEAERPFAKPAGPMVRVVLSNGESFVAAEEHRVLGSDGNWLFCAELQPGFALSRPRTTSGTSLLIHGAGVPRSTETPQDSQSGCRHSPHSHDGQPRLAEETGQGVFPSQGDVPKHISLWGSIHHWFSSLGFHSPAGRSDALGNKLLCSRALSRFSRQSIRDGLHRHAAQCVDILSRVFCRPYTAVLQSSGGLAFSPVRPQSIAGSSRLPQSNGGFAPPDNQSHHALAYVESVEFGGNHVKWDMTVPAYGNYWQSGVIHHNSAKTTFGSRLTVWAAATIPQSEVYCWHVTDKRSIDDQQRFVWEALPESIKKLPTKKGISHSLQYGQKNGFTDGICILPPIPGCQRGGSIKFFNYAQYAQNDQIIEGVKAHFMWADEVIPLELMETIRKGRLMTYHGRLLLTFTVIDGWNDTIQKILAKTRTLETRFCDHPKIMKNLPVMQESLSVDSCAIYYAWSQDNPFTDYQEFLRLNANADRETILARGFGIPTKSITSIHPGFNQEVNVIPHDKLPWLQPKKKDAKGRDVAYGVTRYMVIDPAGSKNWAMAWVAVDTAGTWWVYREWPDYDDWALPGSTLEGKPGPAQKGSKRGIKDYVELIRELEAGEEIHERYIDPRMGAAEKQSDEGATTIISDLDDAGMTVIPASGVDIENGTQLLNNLFAWNDTKPMDTLNSPKIFISDRCQNTIYMFKEHTGKGGRNEATKDFHDLYRYLAVSDIQHIDMNQYSLTQTYGKTGSY